MNGTIYQYGRGFILELEQDGMKGYGEISPLPGWSKESPFEALLQLLSSLRQGPSLNLYPSVSFGLTSAYLDLIQPIEPFEVEVKPKIKLGHLSLKEAESLIYPGCRVDVNRQWPLEKALSFFKKFPPGMFDYIEEPVDKLQDIPLFVKETGHLIALDETVREQPLSLLYQVPGVKALIIKPTMQSNTIELLSQTKIPCVLSSSHETPIGIRRIAELKRRLPFQTYAMGLLPHQEIGGALPVWNGRLKLKEIKFNPCCAQLLTTLKNVRVL
ncbi:MAG: hypothetical protein KBC64_00400 [Simkaniaceae bacterium]|nr:hypothetical protein [Simkaniaceae bacterium]